MHPLCCSLRHVDIQILSSATFSSLALSPTVAAFCRAKQGWNIGRSFSRLASVSNASVVSEDAVMAEDSKTLESTLERQPAHVPVLLKEVVGHFEKQRLLSLVDCTLGGGGHAAAIISSHPEMETFVGMDVDPVAHAEAYPGLQNAMKSRALSGNASDLNLLMKHTNFRNIKSTIKDLHPMVTTGGIDGILMDLGMSSMQVNEADRGFSFMRDGPVDMRMDPTAILSAEEILNTWSEDEIGRILRDLGGERRWKYLARKIVEERLLGGISTTSQLVKIIGGSLFIRTKGKHKRLKQALHPATRTFQALRIAVNDELASLELALRDAFSCLAPGGRMQVITFHSLEDRIVKHFFLNVSGAQKSSFEDEKENAVRDHKYEHIPGKTRHSEYLRKKSFDNEPDQPLRKSSNVIEGKYAKILTKRPITPSDHEISLNPRSRSAKLRVIEKKASKSL